MRATEIASIDHGLVGAFMGYDFHLDASGPQLIEVNTNAEGALLGSALYGAQRNCCDNDPAIGAMFDTRLFEKSIVGMFRAEWLHQRYFGLPKTIALVDSDPEQQYLKPEFVLMLNLLQRAGWKTMIGDVRDFEFTEGQLRLRGLDVDMVYSRSVDFDLSDPAHQALRAAYEGGKTVVTPIPRNHALLADKRNLAVFSSDDVLHQIGVLSDVWDILGASIPSTQIVGKDNQTTLWEGRKNLFFKPGTGYGSRAVYRGDKMTRRVWNKVKSGTYVAQQKVAPSKRVILWGDEATGPIHHKADIRLYTYEGDVLVAVARLYQGQTTNFRTPAGGFVPLFVI